MSAGAAMHTCSQCAELRRTSPEQVFLRCRRHCDDPGGLVQRCHVQPEAPACPSFVERRSLLQEAFRREVAAGVPAGVAAACLTGGVAS